MNELRVCIESTQATNEELLSAWFTLPIDEEEFLEKLGIDAESENYRIVDKALFSDDVRKIPASKGSMTFIPPMQVCQRI